MSDDDLFGEEHVRAYRETDGERGYEWKGTQCLLLTTKGRKSGEERTLPLIFAPDGDRAVIVASKGGAPQHPAWYLNMQANPDDVTVQIKGDVFKARPHDAEGDEYKRLWDVMNGEWPDYAGYQEKTDRKIPIVILDRA